ncbi:MAG: uroporphyrinogen decarboxylase family protein [Eubacteriales bacterium]
MADKEMLRKREERIGKTIRCEKTDKVPFMIIADAYIPYYSQIKLKDVKTYDDAVVANKIMFDDLQNDCIMAPYMPAQVMLAPKLKLLGGGAHVIGENMIKQINPESTQIMEADEYPALIKDPLNYVLETIYPRRYKLLANDNAIEKFEKFTQVLQEAIKFGAYLQKCEEETSSVVIANGMYYFNPIDLIFDLMRNFTGIIKDVKRCPELLRDAGLAMVDGFSKMGTLVPPVAHKALACPMHLPPFISVKDFEKVYWPSFKMLTEAMVSQGHNVLYYFEKNYSHLYEFLQDLPKQRIIGVFEEDDLRFVKKKLGGTMSIAGGLKTNTMCYGTKEECINMTKGLIDDLGRDGGFFIAPDTPLVFPTDAKPENLKAIAETIETYGVN